MDATTPAIVDTDVISFLFKNHSLAPAYQAILAGRMLAVSLISLAEIGAAADGILCAGFSPVSLLCCRTPRQRPYMGANQERL